MKRKQKGQGIVEYALILAFVVGIAMMLNGSNLGGAVKDTFDKVASLLGGSSTNTASAYAQRTKGWNQYATDKELTDNVSSEERLAADQALLIDIANLYLGKNIKDVQEAISGFNADVTLENNAQWPHRGTIWNSFKNGYENYEKYLNGQRDNTNGIVFNPDGFVESSKVQIFKYQEPANTDQTIKVLGGSKHDDAKAAEVITGGAIKASDFVSNNGTTSLNQRVFYSDNMINQGGSRTVHARFGIDYNTKEVTSVHIYAKRDTGNNAAIDGLDLTVSKSGVVYHDNGIVY